MPEDSKSELAWWGEIPRLLLAAARHGELNVLIGAGVSMDVGLPSWEALLRNVSATLSPAYRAEVEAFLGQGRLLDAAELLRSYMTEQDLCHALRESLTHAREPGPLHSAAWRLHPRTLLTTNFDKLLEDAYARDACRVPQIHRGLDVDPPDSLWAEGRT